MNLKFNSEILANEVSAPFTGEWKNLANGRDFLYTIKYSGASGSFRLEYPSPFGGNEGVSLFSAQVSGNGFYDPLFSTSPVPSTRIVFEGSGIFSAAVFSQN